MIHGEHEAPPVVVRVDALINRAIECAASDIHLESTENHLRIRYRIDGILHEQEPLPAEIKQQVLSRIKVLANIDIAQKRVPQDGKFSRMHHDYAIDLRVSTFPSLYGEKIVVRILDRVRNALSLDQLGMHAATLESVRALLAHAHGFMLVCGPTGSGKTTTLYASLAELDSAAFNIITLEDPVEYCVDGITQGQIHPGAGFTFENGMRALLRQDPDVVMVGEVRDSQTAHIATQAALTGHLVLSTVHASDAASVIMRLMDMGIEPFLLNASITGVLAQRLVRTICSECRQSYEPDSTEQATLKYLGIPLRQLHKGIGCSACRKTGMRGRTGIFELLRVTNSLRALIGEQPRFDQVREQACADGMSTLFEDGVRKLVAGEITLQELVRVAV